MANLLKRLLDKRGIKNVADLSNDEAQDYNRWKNMLNKEDLTVDDIRKFCEIQKETIEKQWSNLDNEVLKNERLIMLHVMYSRLLEAIQAPVKQRESAERELEDYLTRKQ